MPSVEFTQVAVKLFTATFLGARSQKQGRLQRAI
jgi:hypothetical protein